jgi:hypothetical protein
MKNVMPELNKISKNFIPLITDIISVNDNALEFGSSSGHVAYFLSKKGCKISLLDIREGPIKVAKHHFSIGGIKTNFYVEDFLSHDRKYDFVYNSGLIQCLEGDDRDKYIKHCSELSGKMLLLFPERLGYLKGNHKAGISGCAEYITSDINNICKKYFKEVSCGKIGKYLIKEDFNYLWILGEK